MSCWQQVYPQNLALLTSAFFKTKIWCCKITFSFLSVHIFCCHPRRTPRNVPIPASITHYPYPHACVCVLRHVCLLYLWVSARLCILKPHFRTSQNFLFLYVLTVAFVCSLSDITAMCRNSVSVLCTSGSVDNITFHVVYWTLIIYSNMFAPLFGCRHVLHILYNGSKRTVRNGGGLSLLSLIAVLLLALPSVLWHCWLVVRNSIQPIKN